MGLMMQPLLTDDLNHVLAHTRGLWDELRGRRLFLTGGTGFFGVWLVESFLWINERLDLDARLVVLSRDPAAFLRKMPHLADRPALAFQPGDVSTFEFPPGPFSHVIHAATPSVASPTTDVPLGLFHTIVDGTRRVLDFARHCAAEKFLLTSSGAVYGRQPPEMTHVPEDFAVLRAPEHRVRGSEYGEGKRVAEHFCAQYAGLYGIEAKISRGFAFVGPHLPLDAHFAVGNFIRDALRGGPIAIGGDGTPWRSYLHAADLAVWLWTILFRGQSCRPYNTGSDVGVTIAELARRVAAAVDPGIEVRIAKRPLPDAARLAYVPSIGRARDELGLRVRLPLDEAIRRTVAWQLQTLRSENP
jgi:dTDP-glucose 4,6-dehydratase